MRCARMEPKYAAKRKQEKCEAEALTSKALNMWLYFDFRARRSMA